MQSNASFTKSLGTLRMNTKTKERSPDLTGTIKIHRHLVTALWNELRETSGTVVDCNLAAWLFPIGIKMMELDAAVVIHVAADTLI
jgi:hypothetical protein